MTASPVTAAALEIGRKYAHDIGAKFGTLVRTPKNPYPKGTAEHQQWRDGFDKAIGEWFA